MSAIPTTARRRVRRREDTCVRCGGIPTDLHHRTRRRETGHSVSNLVRLCRACHAWAHSNVRKARALGIIIPTMRRPPLDTTTIPCVGVRDDGRAGWFLLDDNGGRAEIPAALATELLEAAGMFSPEVAA